MTWNWEQPKWPKFTYDKDSLRPLEEKYARIAGEFRGTLKHVSLKQRNQITIYLLSHEAMETSSIEGETLDRNSVQSSIQKHLGLNPDPQKSLPRESGIAELMIDVFQNFQEALTTGQLHHWNKLINRGRADLDHIDGYRTNPEAMQIVSGPYGKQKVHFQAPPANIIEEEMNAFIEWFNDSRGSLPPLIRACLAHLYFVSIHPYEDGNGRISRALIEKSLSQYHEIPSLTNASGEILRYRKEYYNALEGNNQSLDVTDWIEYLGKTIINAQKKTIAKIELTILKTKTYDQHKDELNERQIKVLEKLFDAGKTGFNGGLSAENYIAITKTSRATATRDLQKLVTLDILTKTGERRHTRYSLVL